MKKLLVGEENSSQDMRDKINEIVDWMDKHERKPPYVRPPKYGG